MIPRSRSDYDGRRAGAGGHGMPGVCPRATRRRDIHDRGWWQPRPVMSKSVKLDGHVGHTVTLTGTTDKERQRSTRRKWL